MMDTRNWTVPGVIALMVVAGFFAVVGFCLVKWPPENQGLNQLIGALITTLAGVVGFFFGSSSSSKGKDDVIAKLSNGNGAPKP